MIKNPGTDTLRASMVGWCLFDFAHSIPATIGGIYFSKWFLQDLNAGNVLLNILFFCSTLTVILIGKKVGKAIDTSGYNFWIKLSCLNVFLTILFLFIASQLCNSTLLIPISFVLFLIFTVNYQIARICHNVYLSRTIPVENRSKMSGLGAASNWAGSLVAVLITLPIISANSQTTGREYTFLAAALAFGLVSSISVYLMLLSRPSKNIPQNIPLASNISLGNLKIPAIIIVYFLVIDVMVTVQRNLPTFLTEVSNLNDNTQAIGFLLILLSALLGGIFAAVKVSEKSSLEWLKNGILLLTFAIILVLLNMHFALWLAFIVAGGTYGILESAIRLNYMQTFSSSTAGENFGMFAIIERTSGIFGPLVWIVPFLFLGETVTSYLTSMSVMCCLLVASFSLLKLKGWS